MDWIIKNIIENIYDVIGIITTAVFSFYTYKVAKAMKDIENNRDKNEINQISFEIVSTLKYNFLLTINDKNNNFKEKIIIPEEWRSKIAKFVSNLELSEIAILQEYFMWFENLKLEKIKLNLSEMLEKSIYLHHVNYYHLIKSDEEKLKLLKSDINNILEKLEELYNKKLKKRKITSKGTWKKEETSFYTNYYKNKILERYKFEYEDCKVDIQIKDGKKNGIEKEYSGEKLIFDGIYVDGKRKSGKLETEEYEFEGEFEKGYMHTGNLKVFSSMWCYDGLVKFEGSIKGNCILEGKGIELISYEINNVYDEIHLGEIVSDDYREMEDLIRECKGYDPVKQHTEEMEYILKHHAAEHYAEEERLAERYWRQNFKFKCKAREIEVKNGRKLESNGEEIEHYI